MVYGALLVVSHNCAVLTTRITGRCHKTLHFTTDVVVVKLPANLYELLNMIGLHNNKITFYRLVKIEHLVFLSKVSLQHHVDNVFKRLALIIALR